jgi:hypothetical protein
MAAERGQSYFPRCTLYCSRPDCHLIQVSSGADCFAQLRCNTCQMVLTVFKDSGPSGFASLVLSADCGRIAPPNPEAE